MAKRAPTNQKPFTALDKGLAASVMNPAAISPPGEAPEHLPETAGLVGGGNGFERIHDAPGNASEAAAGLPPAMTARRPVLGPKTSGTPPEKLSREKRVLLTPSEDREIERCVDRIAEGFGGTPIKLSHVVRACLTVVRHAEGEVIRRAQEVGQLTRPPNGDAMALAEFEHELAKVLAQAFHDAPVLR